jgi:hypothetical protein
MELKKKDKKIPNFFYYMIKNININLLPTKYWMIKVNKNFIDTWAFFRPAHLGFC